MIERIEGTKNGYRLREDSTNEEFKSVIYNRATAEKIRCLIVSADMYRYFHVGYLSNNIITVNNHLNFGEFYINSVH